MDKTKLEKYSSAVSLSDMEIFVFPELMYSLVLANIMSPEVWKWRELDTFKKIERKSSWRKLLRLRQFIMDEYDFNLDLNTWGLTDKDTELKRFQPFISPEEIGKSNALFGYHGDEYYFDIGIRKHFGLDKYEGNVIPYWKTETVEAMNAFKYRQGYSMGAGECVSLSALYMAAAFIVCGIPLEDMYMILTPLHSQNFIDVNEGAISNNRRVVTKSMWFNGTAISDKAQRALRNEQITIVSHNSGYIHCLYDEATINQQVYANFTGKLKAFLEIDLDMAALANFLRSRHDYQKYFVFCRHHRGEDKFVSAEVMFQYEHGSDLRLGSESIDKLLSDVSEEDFVPYKPDERVCVEQLIRFFKKTGIDIDTDEGKKLCKTYFDKYMDNSEQFVEDLCSFCKLDAKLPSNDKAFVDSVPIQLEVDMSREEVIEYLSSIRDSNATADLAFYAYRDLDNCDWLPYLQASLDRCPVSIEEAADMSIGEAYDWLTKMDNESIYDSSRLAHPDEVVNYTRGDGIEKALTFVNIIRHRDPSQKLTVVINKEFVSVLADDEYEFISHKGYAKRIVVSGDGFEVSEI